MKISVVDKHGGGIMSQFAKAINAVVDGRYYRIPEKHGGGFITGFAWPDELRVAIRNYYLNEELQIEWRTEFADNQDEVVFQLNGIFPIFSKENINLISEQPNVFICTQSVSSVMTMPSNTSFRSITMAVTRRHLHDLFGNIAHPVVLSILQAGENFVFETPISPEMIRTAEEMLYTEIPEALERNYYKLKSEELLCHVFALLMQREAAPTSTMNIKDMKAVFEVKTRLHQRLNEAPDIAGLAKDAGMSEPKLRKLFKQTFGKGVFEYYQHIRMQEGAKLLRERKLTVSEVGYQLGFSNLSHFSRVFKDHYGQKPKKYSVG